jgi:hypothetical protein
MQRLMPERGAKLQLRQANTTVVFVRDVSRVRSGMIARYLNVHGGNDADSEGTS